MTPAHSYKCSVAAVECQGAVVGASIATSCLHTHTQTQLIDIVSTCTITSLQSVRVPLTLRPHCRCGDGITYCVIRIATQFDWTLLLAVSLLLLARS